MKQIFLFLTIFVSAGILAQPTIKKELNLPRVGDVIFKQQVEYKDAGRAGADVVWDFGHLQPVNPEYQLRYIPPRLRHDTALYVMGKDTFPANAAVETGHAPSLQNETLIVGREHFTNYFYRYKDSILSLLGYENRLDLMHHLTPLPVAKFPMTFGDSLYRETRSEDLFSSQVPLFTHGEIHLVADAFGMIVLPDGDTLRQVLRTRSFQKILSDRVTAMDSIFVDTEIETYRWYARGYRYPVFETIKTLHKRRGIARNAPVQDGEAPSNFPTGGESSPPVEGLGEAGYLEAEVDTFTTAFFFPPPQNQDINPDTANLAEQERMNLTPVLSSNGERGAWAGMTYNIFPNPVINDLQFELYLPKACNEVHVQIRNQQGLVFIDENKGAYPQGINAFTFDMRGLGVGNYVLDFWLDGYLVHGAVVMKR